MGIADNESGKEMQNHNLFEHYNLSDEGKGRRREENDAGH